MYYAISRFVTIACVISHTAQCADNSGTVNDAIKLLGRVVATYEQAEDASTVIATIERTGESGIRSAHSFAGYELRRAGRLMSLRSTQVNRNSLWIAGADRVWQYSADTKEYTEATRGEGVDVSTMEFIASWYERLCGRFTKLGKLNVRVTISRKEDLRTGGLKHSCVVMKVIPESVGEASWAETLWVERETAIVWKSVMHWPANQNGFATDQTILWSKVDIGALPDKESFEFVVPKGARRVIGAPILRETK
jgi:hypothetical protein